MKKLKDLVQDELVCTVCDGKPDSIVKVFQPLTFSEKGNPCARVGRNTYYSNFEREFFELHEIEHTERRDRIIRIYVSQYPCKVAVKRRSLTVLEECWCRGHGWRVSPVPSGWYDKGDAYYSDDHLNRYLKEIQDKVPHSIPRGSDCARCQHFVGKYYGRSFLCCGMYPYGRTDSKCPDFRLHSYY